MKQPALFIPHGGGPCFFMEPPPEDPTRWLALEDFLRRLPDYLPRRPEALLVISAHWEEARPTLLTSPHPGLLFDYYNFPPHTYQLTYPAPGDPALADRVQTALAAAGIESGRDAARGFDHGVFVPLKVSFPAADLPILQISLQSGLDPARHIAIGKALAAFRSDNILILGSGLSFHNLRALGDQRADAAAAAFDHWLFESLAGRSGPERERALSEWGIAPGGRLSHPREEHLLPLMVAAGAGHEDECQRIFSGTIWGKAVSAFRFG